jgi:hypothetical protein
MIEEPAQCQWSAQPPAKKSAGLIEEETVASYMRRLWPRASSLIEKETMPFWRSFISCQ